MKKENIIIEFVCNPFCLGDRDHHFLLERLRKYGLTMKVFNLWEIEDDKLDKLPEYVSNLITEWRSGKRPGSVYSNLFINGERIPINNWPHSLDLIEDRIKGIIER